MPSQVASGTRTPPIGAFTVTIASPGVFTFSGHGLVAGDMLTFSTTGALPTGLTAGTVYYVISAGLTSNNFEVATTPGGSAVNTSGSQSGTHSLLAEVVLEDSSATGTYVFTVDTVNLASGDVLELRVYKMVLASGTRRVLYLARFNDAQPVDDLIKIFPPVPVEITDSGAFRATLLQTAGAARAFPWSVALY